MKYKSLGAGLAIIVGVLIWQIISIAKTKSKSLIPPPEAVTGGPQQPAEGVSVEVNYMSGKSGNSKIVFAISLNTHSVDLDGIDFQKSVVMQKGDQIFSPEIIEISGSDHHRSAEVKFNRAVPPFKIVFLETPEVNRQEFEFRILEDRR